MIISPHYKLSGCCMVNMCEWNPYTYYTHRLDKISKDLLVYMIDQTEIIEYDSETFIQTIEQDLYKLRKIYESNKSY